MDEYSSGMVKKVIFIFCALLLLFGYGVYSLYSAAVNPIYSETALQQSKYKITLARSRGIIYDCNLLPITNRSQCLYALSSPTPQALLTLKKNSLEKLDGEQLIQDGMPFITKVSTDEKSDDIEYFRLSERYNDNLLCTSLIGYTDYTGTGVCGIERAFDNELKQSNGEISVTYTADAVGRMIAGEAKQVENTCKETKSGIALTIDSDIQQAAEDSAKSIEKGAVVVVSIPDCKIRAMVSAPDYNPNSPEDALDDKNAPMINRALTAYAPGSVFKLVVSAAALESGIDYKEKYYCTGSTISDGLEFNCYDGNGHGLVNLHTALQKSCNCYFINISKLIPAELLVSTAKKLGFGTETPLCSGLSGDSGSLTTVTDLTNDRARSNFAIGQGKVQVTPVQMAALINAIANDGIYTKPGVYEGSVNNEGEIAKYAEGSDSLPVMEVLVAQRIKGYMESAVKYGTAAAGYSENYTVGAKTGTAETDLMAEGKKLVNYWYCGYMSLDGAPKYAIVVLSEGAKTGSNTTGQVFKSIADSIYEKILVKSDKN